MFTRKTFSLLVGFFFFLSSVSANDAVNGEGQFTVPLNHFLEHQVESEKSNYDPLLSVGDIYIPQQHRSVLDAMKFVLAGTSYDINSSVISNPSTSELVKKPIPTVQRRMENITRLEALRVLVGSHHKVLIDPVVRQIGFALQSELSGAAE